MKKVLYIFSLLAIASSLEATESNLEKIQKLQNEISKLKQEIYSNTEIIEENENILEKVETKSILDKINFSPDLELRFDKLRYENDYIETEKTKIPDPSDYTGNAPAPGNLSRRDGYTKDFKIATAVYFNLNMQAAINDNLSFLGRLSFAKNSQSHQRLCILSRDIKSQPSSSAFDVTLAYFDYAFNKNSAYGSTFTVGVLPTFNGTPMQLGQNAQRESMFPSLVFDMNSYGMIYTQKINSLYARAVLAHGYTMRDTYYPYQCNRENIDNATIAGLYIDDSFTFAKTKALLSLGLNALLNFKAHPYLGPDVTSADTKVLGDIFTTGVGLDLTSVAESNLDLFFHTALSIPNGNGKIQDYKITHYAQGEGLTQNDTPGFTEADYASGEMLKKNGYAFFAGTKYVMNKHFDFGLEYNYGSKYWFAATQGAKNMYNKLAVRGNTYEVYAHLILNKYLNAKLGFLDMREKYTGSGWHFGEPVAKRAEQQILYLSLNAKF